MGVTIHYRGHLADLGKLKILCDELVQIAEKMNWPYTRLDEDWSQPTHVRLEHDEKGAHIVGHLGLKGVTFKPHPDCESMDLYFNSDGKLCEPMGIVLVSEGSIKPEDAWINVKTQFAGPEIHMWVVGLLKYIKENYIHDLEVSDEGEYWETSDFDVLKDKMNFLNEKMDAICSELSRVTGHHLKQLSPDELASMIEALLEPKFNNPDDQNVARQYGIIGLLEKIKSGLKQAGKDLEFLKVDDLMAVDEFHTRGRQATREMAEMVNLKSIDRVLDVGCGLGGTARHLAEEYECHVTGVDLTEEYITVGSKLTEMVKLNHRVELRHGSALDLPIESESFDVVWTQHVQMNIADKNRFYSEIARVLKSGGRLLFHDVFRNSADKPVYPVPWADDESMSVLATESEARNLIEDAGMKISQWVVKREASVAFFDRVLSRIDAKGHAPLGIHLLMGGNAEDKLRNYAQNLRDKHLTVVVGMAEKK